jgi:hypothetical protein
MSIQVTEESVRNILKVRISGKLAAEDYQHLVPEFERLLKNRGKLRILVEMIDFHGWEAGALWEDLKFEVRHFADIERLALVGEKGWEKAMSQFCKPFTTAKVRYFDRHDSDLARAWIEEG